MCVCVCVCVCVYNGCLFKVQEIMYWFKNCFFLITSKEKLNPDWLTVETDLQIQHFNDVEFGNG